MAQEQWQPPNYATPKFTPPEYAKPVPDEAQKEHDIRVTAQQENDPGWKQFGRSVINSLTGATEGLLGLEPNAERRDIGDYINLGLQGLGVGAGAYGLFRGGRALMRGRTAAGTVAEPSIIPPVNPANKIEDVVTTPIDVPLDIPLQKPPKPRVRLNRDGTYTPIETSTVPVVTESPTPSISTAAERELRTLPQDLKGAKPRYNIGATGYTPVFDNDLDKALFIIAQKNPSRADARYLKFVMDSTGLDEASARAMGVKLRSYMKTQASGKGGELRVANDWETPTSQTLPSVVESTPKPAQKFATTVERAQEVKRLLRENPEMSLKEAQDIVQGRASLSTRASQPQPLSAWDQLVEQRFKDFEEAGIPREIASQFTPEDSDIIWNHLMGRDEPNFNRVFPKYNLNYIEPLPARPLNKGGIEITSNEQLEKFVNSALPPNEPPSLPPSGGPPSVPPLPEKRGFMEIARSMNARDWMGVPRALITTPDLGPAFRQGIGMFGRRAWFKAWDGLVRAAGSENAALAIRNEILSRPYFRPRPLLDEMGQAVIDTRTGLPKMRESFAEEIGLHITDFTHPLTKKEEQFISSELLEAIPGYGRFVRGSNRSYTTFLNKMRADVFDSWMKDMKGMGINPEVDLVKAKKMAEYINNATGRGSLGKKFEENINELNTVFFSPRLIASRLQLMNPRNYLGKDPQIRKEYWKSFFSIMGAGTTALTLAKGAGADVNLNPTSADFGKAKWGNVRLDPWGGFQQYAVLAARLRPEWSPTIPFLDDPGGNKFTSSTRDNAAPRTLGSGITPTRRDLLVDFGGNKLEPIFRFAWDWLSATPNRPFSASEQLKNSLVPIIVQDLVEIAQEDPALLPLILPASVGMGTQTYGPRPQ